MTVQDQKQLGKTLWEIADGLRGAMNADDFRDYMLSFLFLRYLSDNYEEAVKKELGRDYPQLEEANKHKALGVWYQANETDVPEFDRTGFVSEVRNMEHVDAERRQFLRMTETP